MYRPLCLIVLAALLLCGCGETPPEPPGESADEQPNPVAQEEPRPADVMKPSPSAEAPVGAAARGQAVVEVVRDFLAAVTAQQYNRALALTVAGEVEEQYFVSLNLAFQMDQATVAQAWVGTEQAVVVTNFIAAKQSERTVAWGYGLIRNVDGVWLIRDADFLPDQQTMDTYLDGFRSAEPTAQAVEL